MMKFLDSVALQICQAQYAELHRVEVIFPAVRPIAPFLQSLSKQLGKPAIAPSCFAVDDWAFRRSGLRRPNRLQMISLLYQAYLHAVQEDGSIPDSPEQFLAWSSGLLSDFEEVDAYMLPTETHPIPAEQVFRHLNQQKALEIWNPSGAVPTQIELDYLRFYKLIYPTYLEFRRLLKEQGLDYPAGALRSVWKSIDTNSFTNPIPEAIYWVGFDHINPVLQEIIGKLHQTTKVHWIIDSDLYYLENNTHLAGQWIRQLPDSKPFKEGIAPSNRLSTGAMIVNQSSCAGTLEQMNAGIQQIKNWLAAGIHPEQIGWILGEHSQVWSLLMHWDMPETALHLGMPLDMRWTSSYSWAMKGIEIFQALHFQGKISSAEWKEWITNPLWVNAVAVGAAEDQLRWKKPCFLYETSLRTFFHHGIPLIPWDATKEVSGDLKATQAYLHLAHLATNLAESQEGEYSVAPMERHALRSLSNLIHQIAAQLLPGENPWSIWRKMWAMHLGSAALNPAGNPRDGIRVMSLSDTLALDFEYLVMSGLNEGILPRPGKYRGMLSFDLRGHFGLPEPWVEEARQAYAFYRLLQHCTEARLLYTHSGADGKVTEKSRFLQQLDLEYQGTKLTTPWDLPVRLAANLDQHISIPKTELVQQMLRQRLSNKSISPSSLSIYLKCPLRFWFSSVRGLKTPEEVEEQLNPAQIGSLFHLTLENIFDSWEGHDLTPEQWQRLSEQIPQAWEKACAHPDFKHYSFDQGVNVLVKRMGLQFLNDYFHSETKRSSRERIRLLGQELQFEATLEVDGLQINWKGRLDRLESKSGLNRIVDFKSGNMTSNSKELSLESLSTVLDGEHEKAFQLLCYAWLAHVNPQPLRRNQEKLEQPITLPLELGIIPLQQASIGARLLKVGDKEAIDLHTIQSFEELLRDIFRQILDPELPILQTEDAGRCKYCEFNRFCKRTSDE